LLPITPKNKKPLENQGVFFFLCGIGRNDELKFFETENYQSTTF
jgi:hypothetical protein